MVDLAPTSFNTPDSGYTVTNSPLAPMGFGGASAKPIPASDSGVLATINSWGNQASSTISGQVDKISSLTDMSSIRKNAAGLLGGPSKARVNKTVPVWYQSGNLQTIGAQGNDWRLRVSVANKASILYKTKDAQLLAPLSETDGVIFPITPNINVTHTARYGSTPLTHSNYNTYFYEGSEVAEIAINGEFPIQTNVEGQYLLAAIYFFRAATKMFWGEEELAGTPPPMLYLDGYGSHYFPHVPCVLKGFTHTLQPDVDYIEVTGRGQSLTTRLPTLSQIQITLQPIYSRSTITQFSVSDFARGKLINKGFL
jgi:hypothetical protein